MIIFGQDLPKDLQFTLKLEESLPEKRIKTEGSEDYHDLLFAPQFTGKYNSLACLCIMTSYIHGVSSEIILCTGKTWYLIMCNTEI